ncbi:hypothetical protein EYF80_015689 [Liparis tanakae]|uniref:Uncharacterized protein n=1 Tax=Liparis tanakae TaxID=230148 RepID=A0A4Z2I7X8_9TELE|nr:hypothetical protein EYF80_015689 [Liparis tanakae]
MQAYKRENLSSKIDRYLRAFQLFVFVDFLPSSVETSRHAALTAFNESAEGNAEERRRVEEDKEPIMRYSSPGDRGGHRQEEE